MSIVVQFSFLGSSIAPMKNKKPHTILSLRITLKHMKPAVWRCIDISSASTFRNLHEYIQACMPWGDGHLHSFDKYDSKNGIHRAWLVEDRKLAEKEGLEFLDEESTEERKTLVVDRLKKVGDTCTYCYDFGDGWEHVVKLEKISAPQKDGEYPCCTKTKGVCPFEDCGGPWGWKDKLAIVKNPQHPEYEDIADWLGVEPGEEFDLAEYEMPPEAATEMMRDIL